MNVFHASSRFSALIGPVAALLLAVLLGSCGGKAASDHVPAGLSAFAGDGQVIITFTQNPAYQYWVFGANSPSISTSTWFNLPGARFVTPAYSPQIVSGLSNTVGQYSFVMNTTLNGSPAGGDSAVVSATPRLAGDYWYDYGRQGGLSSGTNLNAIAVSYNVYLAVGSGGAIYTSIDLYGAGALGTHPTWTAQASNVTNNLNSVIWNGLSFVAAGDHATVVSSDDAVNWTVYTGLVFQLAAGGTVHDTTTVKINSITELSGTFVIATSDTSGGSQALYTSTDLINWTQQGAAVVSSTRNVNAIVTVNGTLVALADGGVYYTSSDAVTWVARTIASTPNQPIGSTQNLRAVTFSSTLALYVAVGDGPALFTSPDLINWRAASSVPSSASNLRSVLFSTRFMAVGDSGTALYSDDGYNWYAPQTKAPPAMSTLRGLQFCLGAYVAVGDGGTLTVSY